MGTRQTRLYRGRRHGARLVREIVATLTAARMTAGVSQRALGREIGGSQSEIARLEALDYINVSLVRLSEIASLLGLELSASVHPVGDPIRDKGHQALTARLRAMLATSWRVVAEMPFPLAGDPRSWDLVLRIAPQVVGVEAETRIRDIQATVRRLRQRERDGGVDIVVLVLAESRTNRLLLGELREALGPAFATPPRAVLRALRAGKPLPGSGVVLV